MRNFSSNLHFHIPHSDFRLPTSRFISFYLTLIHCSCIVAFELIYLQHLALTIKPNGKIFHFKCITKEAENVPNEKKQTVNKDKEPTVDASNNLDPQKNKVKFEIYGEEMIEKRVKSSGNSGRVYLPPNWVGHKVKIIRI